MNEEIAIGGHHIEHGEFVLQDLGVALVVDKCQGGTAPQMSLPSVAR